MGKPQDPVFMAIFGCLTATNFKGNETYKYFSNVSNSVSNLSTLLLYLLLQVLGNECVRETSWSCSACSWWRLCSAFSCLVESTAMCVVTRHEHVGMSLAPSSPQTSSHTPCLADGHTLTRYNLPSKCHLPSAEDFWGIPGRISGYLFHLPGISQIILCGFLHKRSW